MEQQAHREDGDTNKDRCDCRAGSQSTPSRPSALTALHNSRRGLWLGLRSLPAIRSGACHPDLLALTGPGCEPCPSGSTLSLCSRLFGRA